MKVDSFIYNKEKIASVFWKKYFEKLKGNKTETYNATFLPKKYLSFYFYVSALQTFHILHKTVYSMFHFNFVALAP